MLGLFAFFYVLLHFLLYLSYQGLDFGDIVKDIALLKDLLTVHRRFPRRRPCGEKSSTPTALPSADRFADYKEKVIDLLKRLTTVSVGSQKVVHEMSKAHR